MASNKGTKRSKKKSTKSDDKEAPSSTVTTVAMEENVNLEVASLEHSEESLETKLTQSNSENEVLKTELVRMGETAMQSEMQRDVMSVFVGSQVAQKAELIGSERNELRKEKELFEMRLRGLEEEMKEVLREKGEIEKMKGDMEAEIESLNGRLDELKIEIVKENKFSDEVSRDRDEMKAKLDIQIAEAERLKGILGDAETQEKLIQDRVQKLSDEYKVVKEKKEEMEREIESIEKMKIRIEEADREKDRINDEKNLEVMKRSALENRVSELEEVVATSKNEEENLRSHVAELEKKLLDGEEKEMEMNRRIDESVKEKNEIEMRLENLTAEKVSLEKRLNETLNQLDEDKRKMEEILTEKNQVAGEKLEKENAIVELEKQVSDLKDDISWIVESSIIQKEKIKSLESEVKHYRDELERVTSERNAARKELDEEKQNGVSLEQKITELEKNIEDTLKLVEKIKAENKNMSSEKGELESNCNILKKEIASLENDLSEVQMVLKDMEDKVAAAESGSRLLLQALEATAEVVHANLEKVATLESSLVDKERSGEIEPDIAARLEEIKNAFKMKENAVEEMKRQVELLQNSVAVAQKKKSFWALLSYATTLIAAISVAYITHGH